MEEEAEGRRERVVVLLVLETRRDEVFGEDMKVEMSTQREGANARQSDGALHPIDQRRDVLTSSKALRESHRRRPIPIPFHLSSAS
jgi:hypothetical protein